MTDNSPASITVLFVDISVASGAVSQGSGKDLAATFKQVLAMLAAIREERGGTLVRVVGNTMLCFFPEVDRALDAACLMQEAMAAWACKHGTDGALRIGLHVGRLTSSGALVGDTAVTIARIVAAAAPQQIVATEGVVKAGAPSFAHTWTPLGKGGVLSGRGKTRVFEFSWRHAEASAAPEAAPQPPVQANPAVTAAVPPARAKVEPERPGRGDPDGLALGLEQRKLNSTQSIDKAAVLKMARRRKAGVRVEPCPELKRPLEALPSETIGASTPMPAAPAAPPTEASGAGEHAASGASASEKRAVSLRLICHGKLLVVDSHRPVAFMGRDEKNDFVLRSDTASRRHCEIEFRRGGFYLIDHSWNGTYLYDEYGYEVVVHHTEVKLPVQGVLCPGSPGDDSEVEAVRFIVAV